MSARKFARDVPRAVREAVRVAGELIDAERKRRRETPGEQHDDSLALDAGEVPGGMPALQRELGYDSVSAFRAVVVQAEAFDLLRRAGPIGHGPRRVFVVEARLKTSEPGACENCACPTDRGRWCYQCQPSFRSDRSWQMQALELAVARRSMPSIAVAVRQDLFPEPDGSPLGGVLAYLIGEAPHLVPQEWKEAYFARVGQALPKNGLRARARQRRHRRKERAA